MLRTNPSLLSYAEDLYRTQGSPEIVLKTFARDSMLLHQGTPTSWLYIIKEGITKCFLSEENDKDYVIEFLSAGEITGDLEMIRSLPCLCNIQALTNVQAYAIRASYFRSLLERDHALTRLMLELLAERVVNTSIRASFQQLYTMEHGLKKLIDFRDKQQIELSKEDMAAYLGITLRSLNRLLKNIAS